MSNPGTHKTPTLLYVVEIVSFECTLIISFQVCEENRKQIPLRLKMELSKLAVLRQASQSLYYVFSRFAKKY